MHRWVGYVGLPVVAVGLLRGDVHVVGSGLSFLLLWQAVLLRAQASARCRSGRGR